MDGQGPGEVIADGVNRVQRGERVLKDHLNLAPERPHGASAAKADALVAQPQAALGR